MQYVFIHENKISFIFFGSHNCQHCECNQAEWEIRKMKKNIKYMIHEDADCRLKMRDNFFL